MCVSVGCPRAARARAPRSSLRAARRRTRSPERAAFLDFTAFARRISSSPKQFGRFLAVCSGCSRGPRARLNACTAGAPHSLAREEHVGRTPAGPQTRHATAACGRGARARPRALRTRPRLAPPHWCAPKCGSSCAAPGTRALRRRRVRGVPAAERRGSRRVRPPSAPPSARAAAGRRRVPPLLSAGSTRSRAARRPPHLGARARAAACGAAANRRHFLWTRAAAAAA